MALLSDSLWTCHGYWTDGEEEEESGGPPAVGTPLGNSTLAAYGAGGDRYLVISPTKVRAKYSIFFTSKDTQVQMVNNQLLLGFMKRSFESSVDFFPPAEQSTGRRRPVVRPPGPAGRGREGVLRAGLGPGVPLRGARAAAAAPVEVQNGQAQ